MSRIAIVYFSQSGATDLLAKAIADGVRSVSDIEPSLLRIMGSQIMEGRWQDQTFLDSISAADTVAFGAPTFMGGPAAQFKAFADATAGIWYTRGWKNKLAAGFTVSGSPSGDKLHTLSYFNIFAAQHGMLWVNWDELPRQPDGTNRLGGFTGLMAQNSLPPDQPVALDPADVLSAMRFGQRIATMTSRLRLVAA